MSRTNNDTQRAAGNGEYYVYSTLSNDQIYTQWEPSVKNADGKDAGGPHTVKHQVAIAGQANVTNPTSFVTPKGVVTRVTAADMAVLENDPDFQAHKANGFIVVEKKSAEIDAVVLHMTPADTSAPLTDAFYAARQRKPPVIGKGQEK